MNVKTIEISQTGANTLQVAEVIAWGTELQQDLALSSLGATASASDYFPAYACLGTVSAHCVIDGEFPINRSTGQGTYEGVWNSKTSVLTITLAEASTLDFVELNFRKDQPKGSGLYTIKLFNTSGGLLDTVQARAGSESHTTGALSVPEPSIVAIFALGLMGLSRRFFKKQS
jgi:hypothetical protein